MSELKLNMGIPGKAKLSYISGDTTVSHDVSEEFSLPDYTPEVRKILAVKAQALPESKYVSDTQNGATVEFGGTVTYCIIYTDDEGKLVSTPLSSNYEARSPISQNTTNVFIDTEVDSVSCRVNAPRKLTLKSRLKSRIMTTSENEIEENITPKSSADEFFIERMSETVKTVSIKTSSMQNIHIADKFDMGEIKEIRPIMCDASVIISESKAQPSYVSVKGEVNVKCVCDTPDGIVTLSKTMPLSEEIETDGAEVGDNARCVARCVSLSISNEQNDEANQLFFDVSLEIECEVMKNEENILTKDCYCTKYESEPTYKDIELYSVLKNANASFTLSESIKRKTKDVYEIIDTIANPLYEKTEIKGGKALILGKLAVNVIGKTAPNENDESEFLSEDYEIPFKYECDIAKSNSEPITRATFGIGNINARYDTDKFYCTAELFPSVSILGKDKTTILDTSVLKKDKEFKNNASCVRVYFPKDGDILWEVAKKYHTTSKKIMEENSLPTASLKDVKNIII